MGELKRFWQRGFLRPAYAIVLGCAVLIAVGWGITLERIRYERDEAVATAVKHNSNLALAFEEHTIRTLRGLDRVLRFARHEYAAHGVDLSNRFIAEEGTLDPAVLNTVAIVDPRGRVVAALNDRKGIDVSDRDYFVHHRDHEGDELRVGVPAVGRVTGKPVVHLSRRISRPDGGFAGVAIVGIDPRYFADFYNLVELGPKGLVLLAGLDGIVRARRDGAAVSYGQDASKGTLFAHLQSHPSGNIVTVGRVEGTARHVSYRTLEGHPLVVAVGMSNEHVFAESSARRTNYVAGASMATLLVLFFGAALLLAAERRRRDAADLARSDARYRATFDQAAVGVTLCAPDGRFLRANATYCRMLGYSEAELQQLNFRDVVYHEDRAMAEQLRRHFVGGETTSPVIEHREVRNDGRVIWTSVTVSLVRDEAGKPVHFAAMIEDITQRKEAEEALRVSESRFRSLTELSSDFYWETDAEHRLIARGSGGKRSPVAAFEQGRQLGKRRWEMPYLTPDEEGWAAHRAILDARRPFRAFELSRLGDDGSERFLSLSGDPVLDAQGSFRGYRGVGTDITERRRAEKELRESERRFRDILGTVHLVSLMLDKDARITYCNDYLLQLTGWKRHEVIGRDWFEVYIPRDQDLRGLFDQLVGDRPAARHHENEILTRSGERRLIRWNNTVLRSIAGEVLGTASIGEDITERVRAEQAALDAARRAAAHANVVGMVSASDALAAGDIDQLARLVTELAAGATGVERANVWLFNEDATELRCIDLYEAGSKRHSAGARLAEAQFVNEFHALKSARCVNADDPLTDPRTAGYVESYLKPLGITSMLDAVVQIPGRHLGLMCLEHVGPAHHWTDDEIAFACQLADKLGLALTNRERREAEERYRATFEQSSVGITHASLDGRFIKVNAKFSSMLGYAEEELLGRMFEDVTHPEDRALTAGTVERLRLDSEDSFAPEYEKRYLRKDGSTLWASVSVSLVRDARGAPQYFIGMVKDVSARREAEAKVVHQAHYDALTELPNRTLFYDRLAQTLNQARRHDWNVGVLFLDVDRFKTVNDTLGHGIGDRLLQEVAKRLAVGVRGGDTVARIGGDEFAVIAADLAHPQDASLVAAKMTEALAMPFMVDGHELFVSGSVGIATYPLDGQDGIALMKNADAAMSRAKDLGRNNYQFYAAAMNERALEKLLLQNDLRRALERDEFRLHFQPKASLADGHIVGFEALLRWQRPGHGLVPPGKFIPLLEESGLIVPVGDWVIGAACAQIRDWQHAGIEPLPIAVNLAAKQFVNRDIAAVVQSALREHGVAARLLEIEITESDAMQSAEHSMEMLRRLKALGVASSIDDFGTGYSSLSYLKRFPVDTLKLDRSFVKGLPDDGDDVSITLAVITMAHSLGLKVVAEGVETAAQRDFLASHGCDVMQGYLLSPPVPAEQCAKHLAPPKRAVAA